MSIIVESVPPSTETAQIISLQVDRVLRSNTLRTCEVLRNLLTYLANCSVQGKSDTLKGKDIATAVFGRSAGFDSQSDSVVRVQTGRLRSKLAEYYVDEGVEDEVILSIPKGSYALAWHPRHPTAPVNVAPMAPDPIAIAELEPNLTNSPAQRGLWTAVTVALMLASALLAFWLGQGQRKNIIDEGQRPALASFWNGFLREADPPFIVFSNLKLAGTLGAGFHIFRDDGRDRDQPVIDSYTTVGEVMGVFDIARTLSQFGHPPRAKNGHLLSWDDARDSSLIFVGGPLADTPLKNVAVFREFKFQDRLASSLSESGAIINVHPRKGESSFYPGPNARPFSFDYAVVSLRPAFSRHHCMLALAGVTEYGTAGAAEFLTHEDQVSELLAALKVKPGQPIPWFEALLRVKVEGEVPVQDELIAVHRVTS